MVTRFGRNAAILAVGAALSLLLSTQNVAAGAQMPLTLSNTGTLLQAGPEPLSATAPVTLWLQSELSSQSPEILASVNKLSNLPNSAITDYEGVASVQSSLVFSSGNSISPFVAWPDETSAFQEMTAAPEPSTWVAALFTVALLAWNRRRRFFSRAASSRGGC